MIHWAIGMVTGYLANRLGLQEVTVRLASGEETKAIHYTDVMPAVYIGDEVLLNTTAMDLGLGTGGYHFIHTVMQSAASGEGRKVDRRVDSQADMQPDTKPAGHLMKLKYTPQQRRILAAEEMESPYHSLFREQRQLEGMPVLIGELHSMLPIAVCWLHYLQQRYQVKCRITYIMSDGAALPLTYSNHMAAIAELGWLEGTVTYGQAYGGEVETLNKYTALIAAKHIFAADIAIVTMGPGIAGTGTPLGHTAVEIGEIINAVRILEGVPIAIPRISFTEGRERHTGLSHHLLTTLSTIALRPARLPLPDGITTAEKAVIIDQLSSSGSELMHEIHWIPPISDAEILASQRPYPQEITTMGRGLDEDATFFRGVCAAAQHAWDQWMQLKWLKQL